MGKPARGTIQPAEDPIRVYWSYWRQGLRPDVRQFLDQADGLTPQQRAAILRVDQRERWQLGERIPASTYLCDHPTVCNDPEAAIELVYGEYLLREELGESPMLDEYAREYPSLAPRLALQVELRAALAGSTSRDLAQEGEGSSSLGTLRLPASGTDEVSPGASRWPLVTGYEVLSELGRGGMGVVYKARHVRLNRVVALKMILAGAHTSERALSRFQAEAEVIASLQHPNIVQIFEVGEQQDQPYLALEYVEGGSLAQTIAVSPMKVRPAALLVETLARAVHAAHRRGIIHRDLKPANVLLAADGTPKITDFGLAMRVEGEVDLSEVGFLVGTPTFMAPEQTSGAIGDVGPATDVYALGAMLYAMLTGHPPFQAATPLEVLEQVRHAEPVAPRQLQPRLSRDLETICLTCLRKDPRRRFASAEALADDLRRFLDGKPILARPVGRLERLGSWCLREPRVAGLLALLALVFAGGLSLVTWQWRRAEAQANVAWDERNKALRERARAEGNYERARRAVGRLTSLGERLTDLPRMDKTARAVLEESLDFYRSFLQEKSNDPGIRWEAALACRRVGRIRHVLGQLEEAEAAFRQGADLLDGLVAESPMNTSYRHELVHCYKGRGHVLRSKGLNALPAALDAYDRAIALGERLLADSPSEAEFQSTVANAFVNRCAVLNRLQRFDAAEAGFGRAIDLQKQALATAPRNVSYRSELALSLDDFGSLLWKKGRAREAEAACRQGLDLRQELIDEGPQPSEFRGYLARSHWHLARILAGTARPKEAEEAYGRAVVLMDGLVADSPDVPSHRSQLIGILADLAALLNAPGRRPEAEQLHRRVLAHCQKLAADFPEMPDYRQQLARRRRDLGILLLAADRHADAAVELRQILNEMPDNAAANDTLAWILVTFPDPRLRDLAQALKLAKKAVAAAPGDGEAWNTLGVAYYRNGDYAASVATLNESMKLRSGGDSLDWFFLAMAHHQLGDAALAEQLYTRATQWMDKHRPKDGELSRFRAEPEALLSPEKAPNATSSHPR